MGSLFTLFISGMLINNIILTKFLGMCPFMGVSTKLDSAVGMGLAVVFVIFCASIVSYGLYYLVLVPLSLEYMELICFILLIAAFVQLVEMFVKKTSPALYKSLGIYLPLITTNCAVLGVALNSVTKGYNILESVVYGFATAFGFFIAIVLMAGVREKIEYNDIPKPFQGTAIVLITACLMSIAFMGFSGMI